MRLIVLAHQLERCQPVGMRSVQQLIGYIGLATLMSRCSADRFPDGGADGFTIDRTISLDTQSTDNIDSGPTATFADGGLLDQGPPPWRFAGCESDASDAIASDAGLIDALPGTSCASALNTNALGERSGDTVAFHFTTCSATPAPRAPLASACSATVQPVLLSYTLREDSRVLASLVTAGTPTNFDTVLDMNLPCQLDQGFGDQGPGYQLCNNDDRTASSTELRSAIVTAELPAGATIYLTVAGRRGVLLPGAVDAGPFELDITEFPLGRHSYAASVGGPSGYEFIDACASGSIALLNGVDPARTNEHSPTPVPLPFPFPFYGLPYSELSVDTNGYLVLGSDVPTDDPALSLPPQIPDIVGRDQAIIAPYLIDMTLQDPGSPDICFFSRGVAPNRVFVIEWHNAHIVGGAPTELGISLTLEAQLFETGEIRFVYENMNIDPFQAAGRDLTDYITGARATIGIQAPGGSDYTLFGGAIATTPFEITLTPP